MDNRGKKFEEKFKIDWEKSFPQSFILRLPDQQSGYWGTSRNVCDYICFADSTLYLLELKSHAGNTFPLTCLGQYDKLMVYEKKHIPGVVIGVVLWMYDHDKVMFVNIKDIKQMIDDGKKSINIKYLDENLYNIIEIPSVKKRVFMDSDYTILSDMNKE